jgi:hypothetical protein
MWRNAVPGKDEALRLIYSFVETLPIAPPSDQTRAEVEPAVERLISLARDRREATRDILTWLRTEFGIETPGQKLEAFATLTPDGFLAEARKRRLRGASTLTPREVSALRSTHAEYAPQIHQLEREANALEQRLATLVNNAYGLTSEEVELMWETAPPRMPGLAEKLHAE